MAQGALAWETGRTKGHISRSGTKGLWSSEARPSDRCLSEILVWRHHQGRGRKQSSQLFPSSVSVHRTSPDTEVVPMFAEHLPQGTTLRASCASSPRILPATVREATGLQVREQPRWCGRNWRSTRWAGRVAPPSSSPPGCPSGRPLPCALPLPSGHLTGRPR